MVDDSALAASRLRRLVHDRLTPALCRETAPVSLTAFHAGSHAEGEEALPRAPVPPRVVITDHAGQFAPIRSGAPLGPIGTTTWLHVTGTVPPQWADDEHGTEPGLIVDLAVAGRAGTRMEALVVTPDGVPVTAITPESRRLPVRPGEQLDHYLECVVVTGDGDGAADPDARGEGLSWIRSVHLERRDLRIAELVEDMRALEGLVLELPADSPRRPEVLQALETVCALVDPDDVPGTVEAAREALVPVLSRTAPPEAPTPAVSGHLWIGGAWRAPAHEARRAVVRNLAAACTLLESAPELVVSVSCAQQIQWLREDSPELFARFEELVAAGRIVAVSGTWAEPDTTLPGSEALARQLIAGTRVVRETLGVEPRQAWLPPGVAHSAALPQLAALAGLDTALLPEVAGDQDRVALPPVIRWEGLDGTTVLARPVPARTPARERAEVGRRAREDRPDPPVRSGELCADPHRGTGSAPWRSLQDAGRSEQLLHEAEFVAALAALRADAPYPYDELEELWQAVLRSHAHDLWTGATTAPAHREIQQDHAVLAERAEEILRTALAALAEAGLGAGPGTADDEPTRAPILLNTAPVPRRGIPAYGAGTVSGSPEAVVVIREGDTITVENSALRAVLDASGALISLRDRASGRESLAPGTRSAVLELHRSLADAAGAARAEACDGPVEACDAPARALEDPLSVEVSEEGAGVRLRYTYSTTVPEGAGSDGVTGAGSTIVKTVVLRPDDESLEIDLDLDWHEHAKALTLGFALDLRADALSREIPFGHLDQPIPTRTSQGPAPAETRAHRWVHVTEGDHGVAIAHDSRCGHDVARTLRAADGGTTTTTRLTLARSPEVPDAVTDHGQGTLRVAVRPGARLREAIEEGYLLALPEREVSAEVAATAATPLVTVDAPTVLVETVKLAEDRSGDLVLRLFESSGARASARVQLDPRLAGSEVVAVDLLERPFPEDAPPFRAALDRDEDGGIALAFHPFEVTTLRVRRPA